MQVFEESVMSCMLAESQASGALQMWDWLGLGSFYQQDHISSHYSFRSGWFGVFLVTCLGAVRILFVQDFGAANVLFCPVRLCF